MSLTKRLVGSTAIVALSSAVARLLTLAVAPLLTAKLGPDPYGTMALVYTGSAMLTTIALCGMDMSYARFYFENEGADSRRVERYCWRFCIVASIALASVPVLLALTTGRLGTLDSVMLVWIGALTFIGSIKVMSETRQRIRGNYARIAAGTIAAGIALTLVSVVLSIFWRQDAWPLFIAAIVSVALNVVIAGTPPYDAVRRSSSLSRERRLEIALLGLPGVVTALMYWTIASSDRWILAIYTDAAQVGIYAFAYSLASIGLMLNSAITLTWFPEAALAYERDRRRAPATLGRLWTRIVSALLLTWLTVASVGGDLLRLIAAESFHAGAVFIPWIAGGVLFFGVASLANTGLLLGKNLKPSAYWWTAGAVLSVALNLVIVRSFGALGAAVVGCACYGFIAVLVMYSSQRVLPLDIPWRRLMLISIFVVCCGCVLSVQTFGVPVQSMLIKALIVATVSTIVVCIMAPDWAQRAMRRVTTRFRSRS